MNFLYYVEHHFVSFILICTGFTLVTHFHTFVRVRARAEWTRPDYSRPVALWWMAWSTTFVMPLFWYWALLLTPYSIIRFPVSLIITTVLLSLFFIAANYAISSKKVLDKLKFKPRHPASEH